MTDVLILGHNDLHLLHRHYINITCVDSGMAATQENGKPKRYNFSAFIVKVEGVTFQSPTTLASQMPVEALCLLAK